MTQLQERDCTVALHDGISHNEVALERQASNC